MFVECWICTYTCCIRCWCYVQVSRRSRYVCMVFRILQCSTISILSVSLLSFLFLQNLAIPSLLSHLRPFFRASTISKYDNTIQHYRLTMYAPMVVRARAHLDAVMLFLLLVAPAFFNAAAVDALACVYGHDETCAPLVTQPCSYAICIYDTRQCQLM